MEEHSSISSRLSPYLSNLRPSGLHPPTAAIPLLYSGDPGSRKRVSCCNPLQLGYFKNALKVGTFHEPMYERYHLVPRIKQQLTKAAMLSWSIYN